MKKYPTNAIQVYKDLSPDSTIDGIAYIPTDEALNNFESYLDPDELEYYNNLHDACKLSIHLCTDPFRNLLWRMNKL